MPPTDPTALADRLAVLRRNPDLGRAMGRAGIRRVRNGFTWKQVASQLLDIYAAVKGSQRERRSPAVRAPELASGALS